MEARPLHDLRADLPALARAPSRSQRKYFWIEEDPELTPRVPRREVPLTAWA